MIKLILFFLSAIYSQEFYTSDQILNKVLISTSALKGRMTTSQALNAVFYSPANALNIYIDTTSSSANPFVLREGDTMTGQFTLLNSTLTIIGIITISTTTTSSVNLCLVGAVNTLPTSGYSEGCMAYQISDHTLYISTETVVGIQSWKPVW